VGAIQCPLPDGVTVAVSSGDGYLARAVQLVSPSPSLLSFDNGAAIIPSIPCRFVVAKDVSGPLTR